MPKIRSFVLGLSVVAAIAWYAPRPMGEEVYGGHQCNSKLVSLTCPGGGACPSISRAQPTGWWEADLYYNTAAPANNCTSWTTNGTTPCGAFSFHDDYYGWCDGAF